MRVIVEERRFNVILWLIFIFLSPEILLSLVVGWQLIYAISHSLIKKLTQFVDISLSISVSQLSMAFNCAHCKPS